MLRYRAEEARMQAQKMIDPVYRSMFIQVAETYERMIEWQRKSDRSLQSF
jgi:hypothetical protein